MYSEKQLNILEEIKKEGLYLINGSMNSSYPKKFINSITPERKEWFDSIPGNSLSQKIYNLTKDLEIPPGCNICGKDVKFISPKEGYREYCCAKCRAVGEADNVAQTNLKKYGSKSPAGNKSVQEKMKATTQENYGVDNIFKRTDIIKKATMEKYGVESVMHLDIYKEKIVATSKKKYGTASPLQSQIVIDKRNQTNLAKYGNFSSLHGKEIQKSILGDKRRKHFVNVISGEKFANIATPLFSLDSYVGNVDDATQVVYYPWKCVACNYVFEDYIANGKIPRCPKCYPSTVQGTMEKEVVDWIKEEFPNKELVLNSRRIIAPLEIDIYLPEHKLAIEFDEVAWHSEVRSGGVRGNKYHIGKTNSCQIKGINLIHVLDSEWHSSKEIVKSIIRARLNIFNNKIGARECVVRTVSSKDSKNFLDLNHIQGYAPASIRYGLYHKNELVSLLCLGKNRFKEGTFEVVRFANKLNTQVMGGLSKLWKSAKLHLPEEFNLISYVDLRFFHGRSNEQMGLKYQYTNPPGFSYTKDYKTLYNRMAFQKGVLSEKLENFDPNLTEWENMQNNGYDRIWDCGTAVYSNKSKDFNL